MALKFYVKQLTGFLSLWRLFSVTVDSDDAECSDKMLRVIMDPSEKYTETTVLEFVLCQQASGSGCSNDKTSLNFPFLDIV
jgi:hypothetical protein